MSYCKRISRIGCTNNCLYSLTHHGLMKVNQLPKKNQSLHHRHETRAFASCFKRDVTLLLHRTADDEIHFVNPWFFVEIKICKVWRCLRNLLTFSEGKLAKDDCDMLTVQLHQEGKVHNYKRNPQGNVRFFCWLRWCHIEIILHRSLTKFISSIISISKDMLGISPSSSRNVSFGRIYPI